MILYFTGTGNSRYCADFLGHKLGDKVYNLAERIKAEDYSALESEKPYIICVPTYAWRIPFVVTELLKKTELKGSKDVYFVMTCGGEIGKAEKYNRAFCVSIGKNHKGTLKVKMPENYLVMFDVTDEKREAELMVEAGVTLAEAVTAIGEGVDLPTVKEGAIGAVLSGPVNVMFNKFYLKDDGFRVTDSCISCGICESRCPLGNIEMREGRPLWKGNCTHCMACISYCPKEAIECGKRSAGKRRYRCREYKGE